MTNLPLPDNDHVSRYCKPSTVERGIPLSAAFMPKRGEDYLSVNWLEYFGEPALDTAIDRVRQVFRDKNYQMRPRGRFAVLKVGDVKTAALESVRHTLDIDHLPLSDDQSHAGIRGYGSEDLAVAVELAALVTRQDVHLAIV